MNSDVLFIGVGNMGGALVRGLRREGAQKAATVHLVDKNLSRLDEFKGSNSVVCSAAIPEGPIENQVVVLCVKPQDFKAVAGEIRSRIHAQAVVVSILAGLTIDDLASALNFEGAIVRAMPNVPATVHAAATAMSANPQCSTGHLKLAESLFQGVGKFWWVEERLMDAVTGLSGSGPAFLFLMMEALVDGGVKAGLPRPLAKELVIQTVLGAAVQASASSEHFAALKDSVTTPGGTAIHGLREMESAGIRAGLIDAVGAAAERSRILRERR
jgi:pyrroline-5-carboxylate reductase